MLQSSLAVDEIIAGREPGRHEQTAFHRYILTLFGIYGRPAGTVIPIAALVRLLAELDAEPSGVRTSISRLKKKGVLVSHKTRAGSSYALLETLEHHMQLGDERIFSPRSVGIGDAWLLVSFSVPESERQHRHKIRAGLARMGFGTVAAGLYIAPVRLQAETVDYIREHQLWDYVELFVGKPAGFGDIREKVSQWWNLAALKKEYQSFLDAYAPEVQKWQNTLMQGTAAPREAFKTYIPMVTQWRRLPYLDPGLPTEILPAHWEGVTARKVFSDLQHLLKPLSDQHVAQILRDCG